MSDYIINTSHAIPRIRNKKKKRGKGRRALKTTIILEVKSGSQTYGYEAVAEAIRGTFKGCSCQFLDHEFTALPLETWRKILNFSQIDKIKYIATKRDCDNFAIALSGECSLKFGINGVGIVIDIDGKHAYNVLLVEGKEGLEVAVVEPQTDGFVKIGDNLSGQEAYKGTKGWILFA